MGTTHRRRKYSDVRSSSWSFLADANDLFVCHLLPTFIPMHITLCLEPNNKRSHQTNWLNGSNSLLMYIFWRLYLQNLGKDSILLVFSSFERCRQLLPDSLFANFRHVCVAKFSGLPNFALSLLFPHGQVGSGGGSWLGRKKGAGQTRTTTTQVLLRCRFRKNQFPPPLFTLSSSKAALVGTKRS